MSRFKNVGRLKEQNNKQILIIVFYFKIVRLFYFPDSLCLFFTESLDFYCPLYLVFRGQHLKTEGEKSFNWDSGPRTGPLN